MNRKVLAVPYAVWILGFIIIPLCFIFGRAFTTAEGAFTLSNIFAIVDPLHRKALVLSLELAFLCTTICIILAYPLALIVRNSKMKSSGVIMLILIMPMWMNSILRILALQMILSNNGILNFVLTSLGLQPLQIINTKGAIVLGMVYDFLPYMILPIYTVLSKLDNSLVEAAHDLGSGRATTFRRVILPLSLPGLLSGITMVFVPCVSTFYITQKLGGGQIVLIGDVIESQFQSANNYHLGAALSFVLMILIFVCLGVMNYFDDGTQDGGVVI